MTTSAIAIRATAPAYYGLRHPSGLGLESNGYGSWPADSFTFGLVREMVLAFQDNTPPPEDLDPQISDTVFVLRDGRYVPFTIAELVAYLGPAVAAGKQPLDADLTAIAEQGTTLFGRLLLTVPNQGVARSTLGLATVASSGAIIDLDLSGLPTALPATPGKAWNNGGLLSIS